MGLDRERMNRQQARSMLRKACVSAQDIRILRRATLASSLRTWTLIAPPAAMAASARSAFAASADAM